MIFAAKQKKKMMLNSFVRAFGKELKKYGKKSLGILYNKSILITFCDFTVQSFRSLASYIV